MNPRASRLVAAAAFIAALSQAVAAPPLAREWNIATSGSAASSGKLVFQVTAADVRDPVSISVPVIAGAQEKTVAGSIRRALGSQLRRDRFVVEQGEAGNVMVRDARGRPEIALELVDSDVENLRVAVQSVSPAASPTVPPQATPADMPPTTPTPPPLTPDLPARSTEPPRLPNTSPPSS
jgi:hypothetical protein